MAAPPEITLRNLAGRWQLNKKYSDNSEAMLALQGMNLFMRKAISRAAPSLSIVQSTKPVEGAPPEAPPVTHLEITQSSIGLKGIVERRVLDWQPRDNDSYLFGKITGRSRWQLLQDIDGGDDGAEQRCVAHLHDGWEEGTVELIEGRLENVAYGWVMRQTWGFELVDGNRHYVRHVVTFKGEKFETAKIVYDWVGPPIA